MNGSELGVPKQQTVISIDIWKPDDVQPMAELTPTWVHVTGVPNSVRHFLGLWAVGTLIGKTMDVDLLALRRNNVARILVAIRNPNLFETREVKSDAFLLLKGYSFRFTREASDYVVEPDFVPFIWKRNEKDDDTKGLEDKDHEETHRSGPTKAADGDTHMPQANAMGPGASTLGLVGAMAVLREIAVTPFNMNPQTPRGKELVEQVVSARNVTLDDGHKKKSAVNDHGQLLGCLTPPCVAACEERQLPKVLPQVQDAKGHVLIRSHLGVDRPASSQGQGACPCTEDVLPTQAHSQDGLCDSGLLSPLRGRRAGPGAANDGQLLGAEVSATPRHGPDALLVGAGCTLPEQSLLRPAGPLLTADTVIDDTTTTSRELAMGEGSTSHVPFPVLTPLSSVGFSLGTSVENNIID